MKDSITVQQLYDYAVLHNYINTDAQTVLNIINQDLTSFITKSTETTANVNNINFNTLVEYTFEDVVALLST